MQQRTGGLQPAALLAKNLQADLYVQHSDHRLSDFLRAAAQAQHCLPARDTRASL